MAQLTLTGVTKFYGTQPVLHGIDLTVAEGEFVAFVGPSGCGKSTLLRLICGLDDVSGGTMEIDGQLMNGVPAARRGIAMVFQSYALYPHMTVARNMGYALRLANTPRAEIDRRVNQAAETLRLTPLLQRKPRELSGGQRQRVAIGRAIVREPRLFLFDEPLSNLDAALRVEMRAEIAALKRRLGTTMIYVTHDQVEAMTLADRIVVMHAGRVEQAGAPLDLYHHPANRFVATFIGSPRMNLLPATLDAAQRPVLPGGRALPIQVAANPGTAIEIGIRPEHMDVAAEGELQAEILAVEHLGAEHFLHLSLPGLERPLLLRAEGDAARRIGERVALRLDPGRLHPFGADGLRLPVSLPDQDPTNRRNQP